MIFRSIESIEDAKAVFPVMRELRLHLDETTYLELLQSAKTSSAYHLLGVFDEQVCLGLMGFRVLFDFVHGKHLYIDDLVVTEKARSRGIGAQLLEKAKEVALRENCVGLRLCTGTENEAGKRFYEKLGWNLRAVAYKFKF